MKKTLFISGWLFLVAFMATPLYATVLTVSGLVATNKIYDGTTPTTVNFTGAILNGVDPGDQGNVTLVTTGYTADFADKNVGSGKSVFVTGLTLGGSAAGNYTLTQPTLSGNINARTLVVTAAGVNRTYDATLNATVNLSDNKVGSDDVQDFYDSASFADKNVGTNKPVSVTDIFILGTDSGNYNLSNDTATTTANISSKTLHVGATGHNKPYDGNTTATVTFSDNHIAGDSLTETNTSATFTDQFVGNGKTINVTGIGITGPDAANYALTSTTAHAQGNITARTLNVTAIGQNKPYDGTTNVTVALNDDRISGDDITVSFDSAGFSSKSVGTNKTVTVYDIVITGPDSDSYAPASANVTTTANISSRVLTVVATGQNKPYDGGTNATVTLTDNRLTGDNITNVYVSASFGDKAVGVGKTVSVTGISVTGPDAGNYTLGNTTANAQASITARNLTVTAAGVDKVYDGGTNATVTLSDDRITGDSLTDSYSSASFADANAGSAKPVSVVGIQVTGADSGNYTLTSTTASTSANITGRTLNVAATGQDKIYNGTTNATVTLSDNRLSGDSITVAYTNASFGDKNVGSGKTVSVTGINVTGLNASNYSLANSNTTASANITVRSLTVTATGIDKIYNGTTAATVTLSDDRVSGDVFTDNYGSANFTDSAVGNGKTVNVSAIFISGTDAGNYSLNNTTATASANILKAGASASLTSSENPSGFHDAIAFTDTLAADATGSVAYFTNGVAFNSGSLVSGAYTSGSITNLPRGTNTITAIYSGDGNYASVTNVLAQVVTNHPPVTGFFSFNETNGISLKVKISDLLTAVVDADGDPISLVSVGTSTNGIVSPTNATFILFQNTNLVNDRFSYVVTDGQGSFATGQVAVVSVVVPFTGQPVSMTISGASNLVTSSGIPGYTYIVQRSLNLLTWVNVGTNTAASNGAISVTDTFSDLSGPPASAFYRLEYVP